MEGLRFDAEASSEYWDDFNYSQGFYVTPSIDGSAMIGAIRQVGDCSIAVEHHPKAESAARFVVEEHNRNTAEGENKGLPSPLKFLRIVNLNFQPSAGAIYYITMEVADSTGERSHYQAKVRVKLNGGYRLYVFRPAPYCVKSSDKVGKELCCVGINNLKPWMNESYLYYKALLQNQT